MKINESANSAVREVVKGLISAGREIGVQVVAYLNGECVIDVSEGIKDADSGERVTRDTLFNIMSVTKALPVTAAHIQAERGLLDYDEPIAKYWPEWGCKGKEAATVRHALTHCAGAPQMPDGVTTDTIGDWDFVAAGIAALPLMYPVGTPAYQSSTHGWIVGEIVRRTDPQNRSFQQFFQEEICQPLGIEDLWIGIPDRVEPRIAKLVDNTSFQKPAPDSPLAKASPSHLRLSPEIYETPAMQRACLAGTGGIANASSVARVWAMLANGGELDGVRLLSKQRIDTFSGPRESNLPDPVLFNMVMPISQAGYFLHGNGMPDVGPAVGPRTISYAGHGGSLAWADLDTGLAVAFCHNYMITPKTIESHPAFDIANTIRRELGLT